MEVESQEDCSSLDDWPYELLSESTPVNTARSIIHSIDNPAIQQWVKSLPRGLAGPRPGKQSVYPAIAVSKHLWKPIIPTKENARTCSGELADGCP